MQHGALFRDVDFLSPEHGIDPCAQVGCLRQIEQQPEGLCGNAVFRVIEVDPGSLGGHVLAALRIVREEFSQVQIADLVVMAFEGLPRRVLGQ